MPIPANVKTGTLGLPAVPNYTFNSTANIAPSFHVGPRMYNDGGYIPHPLSYTGQPGPTPSKKVTRPAGALTTAPGGLATDIAWPHAFSINGREPG
jgi:hypothetical protein